MVKEIVLHTGDVTLVDDDNFERLSIYRWRLTPDGYAHGYVGIPRRSHGTYLHNMVLAPINGMQVDHIDGDKLNNQRSNLRHVTNSQNQQNREIFGYPTRTGVRGITVREGLPRPYQVRITVDGRRTTIGWFETIEEATVALRAARRSLMTHCREQQLPESEFSTEHLNIYERLKP